MKELSYAGRNPPPPHCAAGNCDGILFDRTSYVRNPSILVEFPKGPAEFTLAVAPMSWSSLNLRSRAHPQADLATDFKVLDERAVVRLLPQVQAAARTEAAPGAAACRRRRCGRQGVGCQGAQGTKRWASRHQGSEHQVLHCLISFACEDVQCAANCFLSKQRAVILFPVK